MLLSTRNHSRGKFPPNGFLKGRASGSRHVARLDYVDDQLIWHFGPVLKSSICLHFQISKQDGLARIVLVSLHLVELSENWKLCHCSIHGSDVYRSHNNG